MVKIITFFYTIPGVALDPRISALLTSDKKNGKTRTDSKGKTRRIITAPVAQEEKQMHVFFDGPFSDGGASAHDGDESPFWIIKVATEPDAEPKYAYRVWNFEKARSLAEKISKDQDAELISSAISAN